jgi:sigma-B regulation protein RsbU (phosphoserine phosphatase)
VTGAEPEAISTERLALLIRLAQAFSSTLDLDQVLSRVMDEVIAAVHAERGFVMLQEAENRLAFRVARGIDQHAIEDPSFQVSRGVLARVAAAGQPVLTSDAQHDDRFSMRQSIMSLGLRSILCVPLIVRDQVTGVIYVDNRLHAGIFTPADLDLLAAIASSAAIAIENARLYQAAVETGRLERELQMARELQAGLLPHETPHAPGWEFVARWQPARQVAGDFYDFIPVAGGQIGVVIADVADKGLAAAIFMALTRSTVRASLASAPSPAEGIARANRLICADAAAGMFVTLFYGQLDPATGQLTYVNAGHDPAILCANDGDRCALLERTGLILGVDTEAVYGQRTVQLEAGDCVLLYTDGVTDAALDTAPDDRFGSARLAALVEAHHGAAAAELVAALDRALQPYIGPAGPFDDVTLVAIRRR